MDPLNPLMREAQNALFRGLLSLPEMYMKEGKIRINVMKIETKTPYITGLTMSYGDGINVGGALREIMAGDRSGNFGAFVRGYYMYWRIMKNEV